MRNTAPLRKQGMLAGDVATLLGIGVQTLHYYERERLIPPPPRSESGYRIYSPELVDRVRFIRKAQALGLPLAEVRDVLRLAEQGTSPCGRVQAALDAKLRDVDERLRELQTFRDELTTLIHEAPARQNDGRLTQVCAIVEEAPPLQAIRGARPPFKGRRQRV